MVSSVEADHSVKTEEEEEVVLRTEEQEEKQGVVIRTEDEEEC